MGNEPTNVELGAKRVRIAAAHLADAKQFFDVQIRDAHEKGLSLRSIAAAAGISHEQVRRIIST